MARHRGGPPRYLLYCQTHLVVEGGDLLLTLRGQQEGVHLLLQGVILVNTVIHSVRQ